MKITGSKAQVFFDEMNASNIVVGGTDVKIDNEKYFVIEKGANSEIPVGAGEFFMLPENASIALVEGDRVLGIDEKRFCKTSASFEFSYGSVDVGDDCDPGATISDGIMSLSGSLAGLFRYDDMTQEFDEVTDIIINKFLDITEDDAKGIYKLYPRNDSQVYLLTLLNSGTKTGGQYENWLFAPINITSMSMSLGNTDAQNKDLSFTKGEGKPMIYKRLIKGL